MSESKFSRARRFLFPGALAILALVFVVVPRLASAQAAPGPQAQAVPPAETSSTSKPHAVSPIGGHPNLSGNWKLNKDQSDDPRQKMREAMGGGGGRGSGGGHRGGGGEGRGNDMLADFSALTISQTATSAKVVGSSGRVLALYSSDSSAPARSDASSGTSADSGNGASSGNQTAPAEWHESQLVTTTEGRRGGSTTRTYELSSDGTQLYVITKVDNPRLEQPVTFRLVYDPGPKGGASE